LIAENKFDLIHAFFGIPCGYIAMKLGLPYIVSLRGSDVPFYNPRFKVLDRIIFQKLSRRIWRNAKKVVANSEGLKTLAKKTFGGEIEVIPNGIDVDEFNVGKIKRSGKIIKLVSTGRLISRKGYQYLIPALKNIPEIRLSLIGGGNMKEELQDIATDCGVSVDFLGQIEHDDIAKYLGESDIFILPSLNEGMSNSVLEAMACGLPIITTNTGGSKELIDENGTIIKMRSSQSIKKALRKYLNNKKLINIEGKRSREIAESLSWKSVAKKYIKTYEVI